MTYMGGLRSDSRLVQLAQLTYASALEESHPYIQQAIVDCNAGSRPKANLQLLLLLTIAFQTFEFVRGTESSEAALFTHVDGALSVLELSGPQQYRSAQIRQAFSGFRGILVSVALHRRQPTFLAEPNWIELPFEGFRKTRRELLHDLALQIPGLLYRTDRLISGLVNTDDTSDCRGPPGVSDQDHGPASLLLVDYYTILHRIEEWLNNWKSSESGPLYWTSTLPMPRMIVEVDMECIPSFTDTAFQLRFLSGQKAGLLITYWDFLLELLMGIIDLKRGIPDVQNDTLEEDLYMAQKTACLILEAAPYLLSCFEGTIVSKAPLQTALRYFELQHVGPRFGH